MYHRIIEKKETRYYIQDGMYVDPDTFRMHITYLMEKFNIVSLESVLSIGNNKNKYNNNKPCCVITFDDGWDDFYKNAYPILKYLNVCSTVFLPTDFIGTDKMFWTDRLAYILKCISYSSDNNIINNNISSLLDDVIKRIKNKHGPNDVLIEKSIQILKHLPTDDIENILDELAHKWSVDINYQEQSFLSWEKIKEMHESRIVYFGSHTKTHQILTTIGDNDIRQELIQSKNKLIEKNVVSTSFIPFAYPNGNYTQEISSIVQEVGYNIALTTKRGWNSVKTDRANLYALKRVGIHQDMASTTSMMACRIFGIY